MLKSLFILLLAIPLIAEELTLEKIHSDSGLSGQSLWSPKFSPNGRFVTYLQSRPDNARHYDLWSYDIITGHRTRLVNSDDLFEGEEVLSDEEKARRERMRINATGLVSYQWAKDNSGILFPLAGDLFYFELLTRKSKQITNTEEFELDAKLSPDGTMVAFVREQDLFVIELDTGEETAITSGGLGPVKYGMAEFVAQEEMNRHTGYWWGPESKYIAFTRVDESQVNIIRRNEIYQDRIDIIEQRYPKTGQANAMVKLVVADLAKGTVNWISLGHDTDSYLPRVQWTPSSEKLTYQWQNRNQGSLDLYEVDHQSDQSKVLVSERSLTWINLHNDLHFLADDGGIIWTSERTGFNHIYHVKGGKLNSLTSGDWPVGEVVSVDEKNGWIYFTGWIESPLENHLYQIPIQGGPPKKISKRPGWHKITFSKDSSHYFDSYSNDKQPTQVSLHRADGTLIDYLLPNKLNDRHPLTPFLDDWIDPVFGTLKTEDGVDLHYKLFKPKGEVPEGGFPAIVYVYGGPGSQQVRKSWSRRHLWTQYLLKKGYAFFVLDNRGSANRGKAFEDHIYKQLGDIELKDQLIGAKWLKKQDWIDGSRVGIHGHSYGGYMTLMAMFKAGDVYACGISGAPVTDFRLYDTHYTERFLSTPQKNPKGYDATSVLTYSEGLKGDLLLYHGMADDNVLFTNATMLVSKLQKEGKLFEFMAYPGAKHGISGPQRQLHLFRTMEDFFDRKIGSRWK